MLAHWVRQTTGNAMFRQLQESVMRDFFAPILVAAVATLAVLAPATAAPLTETRIGVVSTTDLDLSTTQGATQLNARIHQTANALCGTPDLTDLRQMVAVRKCRVSAVESAQSQVEAAVQAAMQSAQASRPTTVRVSTAQ
jgi:UrcA family protein